MPRHRSAIAGVLVFFRTAPLAVVDVAYDLVREEVAARRTKAEEAKAIKEKTRGKQSKARVKVEPRVETATAANKPAPSNGRRKGRKPKDQELPMQGENVHDEAVDELVAQD